MAISISDLVRNPQKLDNDTLVALRERIAEYPYDQTARLLLLYTMYQQRDADYTNALHKQAIYLADRNLLYRSTEGGAFGLSTALNTSAAPSARQHERSANLIDQFLSSSRAKEGPRATTPAQTDPTGDYMAYWAQQHAEEVCKPEADASTAGGRRLSTLLHEAASMPLEAPEAPVTTPEASVLPTGGTATDNNISTNAQATPEVAEQSPCEQDFFTERLAKIYIKQGRYERAIEILRVLSVHNPKKSRYFADQIRFLHKLTINNNFAPRP